MAESGLLRSMEAMAAASIACSGAERDTPAFAAATNCSTACAVVMTSMVAAFVSVNKPSPTTNRIECVPTGKTVIAITSLARRFPASDHVYCNKSPSRSEERDPSRITVALLPFGEMASDTVALASATGGLSQTICCSNDYQQVSRPLGL